MSVFDAEQIEILLPVRAFFGQRRIAKTAFNPGGEAFVADARLIHVVDVLVASD